MSTLAPPPTYVVDSGDTAWLLAASALVFIMTPGLGFFYGGLVKSNFIVNTLMMSWITIAVVSVQWLAFGFSFAFGPGTPGFGSFAWAGLSNVGETPNPDLAPTIPAYAYCIFQLMFAIITPALISGAIVQRMKFFSYVLFITVWSTVIYDAIAHWVWSGWTNSSGQYETGWIRNLGTLDFAGGTVVHISSGFAALAAALVVGPRAKGNVIRAHSVPFVLLGAALLWFGWFGFNGGSSLTASGLGSIAFLNSQIAASAAFLSWVVLDAIFYEGKSAAIGGATGAVVGLVAITPAAGFVEPWAAIPIGLIAVLAVYGAIELKRRISFLRERLDDTLDVFSCHGLGGFMGSMLTGFFATTDVNPGGNNGVFYGNGRQLWVQFVAVITVMAFSFVGTGLILLLIKYIPKLGLRSNDELQALGDMAMHGEEGYALDKEGHEMEAGTSSTQPQQNGA